MHVSHADHIRRVGIIAGRVKEAFPDWRVETRVEDADTFGLFTILELHRRDAERREDVSMTLDNSVVDTSDIELLTKSVIRHLSDQIAEARETPRD